MSRVTLCMSPSSREEGHAEKGQPSRQEGGVLWGGKRGGTVIVCSGGRRVKWRSELAKEKGERRLARSGHQRACGTGRHDLSPLAKGKEAHNPLTAQELVQ
jgi:hypothetical protein